MSRNLALLFAALAFWLTGCGDKTLPQDSVIARAGSRQFTRDDFAALAGAPLDSVIESERWTIINNWADNAVVEQEGERRGLPRDPQLQAQLARVRSELFLARILEEDRADSIAREEIETYYAAHREEFMQTEDGFFVELYFAKDCADLWDYQQRCKNGDTELSSDDPVRLEQRWLAQASELNDYLRIVLSGLGPDSWTESREDAQGCRVLHLLTTYPAGTLLDLEAARGEIEMQLRIVKAHRQREDLMSDLRGRYPVTIFLEDSQ